MMTVSLSLSLSVLSVQQKQQLDGVVYSSRFAVALFFAPDVVFSFPWTARYVTDNHCIRYIAADSRKRNAGLSAGLSVRLSSLLTIDEKKNDLHFKLCYGFLWYLMVV